MEMEKNSTLKYGIWLTGASMMFVSAWFCVRLTGTVGEMGRYLDSMDSVVCMEELLDYEKEENGRTMEENDLAEPTLQVRMLEREDRQHAAFYQQRGLSGAFENRGGGSRIGGFKRQDFGCKRRLKPGKERAVPGLCDRCGVSAQQRCLSVFPGKKRNDRHCFNQ